MAFKMGFTGVMSTVLSFIRPPIGPTGKTLDSLDSPCGAETAKFTLLGSNIPHPPGVLQDNLLESTNLSSLSSVLTTSARLRPTLFLALEP